MEVRLLTAIATIVSSLAALLAVGIAFIAERRARVSEERSTAVAQAQVYLALRSRFLEIFERLGDLKRPPENKSEEAARYAYWHHSFDEWFIAEKLAPELFKQLWGGFFERAATSGRAHEGLEAALGDLASESQAGFAAYAEEFINCIRPS
jgi:hypothetical protein